MKFKPKSEKEIAEMNLLSKGEYSFEIVDAEEKVSKAGTPMLVLKLRLFDQNLKTCGYVKDYLLESMAHKLRHAAYSCGLGDNYEMGELTASVFRHKHGTVKIGIQIDKNGAYPDKNVVFDYLITGDKKSGNFNEDDIPF